jgi:hypothetical protein
MVKYSILIVCISTALLIYCINYIYRRVAIIENVLKIRKIMGKEQENGND